MKRKLLKQKGVTLLELLITVSLVGLIFGFGISPMLSQITLFKVEKAAIALFDDANLVANYITGDAMRSEKADDTTEYEIIFTITTDHTTSPRTTKTVRYHVINDTELERIDSVEGKRVITNKIDGRVVDEKRVNWPHFDIGPDASGENHRLKCSLSFQDPDDASIETERSFDVMLRCRDKQLVKP
ncbi:MAG: type II secretion system protein [Candidatus Omnitrophota bacterium]|nr:MAG: type II secretion system protein [Candidatus Omnitrophota bacterium]